MKILCGRYFSDEAAPAGARTHFLQLANHHTSASRSSPSEIKEPLDLTGIDGRALMVSTDAVHHSQSVHDVIRISMRAASLVWRSIGAGPMPSALQIGEA